MKFSVKNFFSKWDQIRSVQWKQKLDRKKAIFLRI